MTDKPPVFVEVEEIGMYMAASLYSPMGRFDVHEMAVATAWHPGQHMALASPLIVTGNLASLGTGKPQ